MNYVEEINKKLLWLKEVVDDFQKYYSIDVKGINEAYESAQQDENYDRLVKYYSDLKNSVGSFISSIKTNITALPKLYCVKECKSTKDVGNEVAKLGFADYTKDLVSRCNSEMTKITAKSTPDEDIKTIEKLSEYYAEINYVCNQFNGLYYKYVRTPQMLQAAYDEYNADVDKLKNDLNKKSNSAITEALSAIGEHKATYQQITDTFLEERFAAQIGKQHPIFPKKICLGAIIHPVVDCCRDVLSKALSCGNVDSLPILFEMPLVGGFDEYEAVSIVEESSPTQPKKSLIDDFDLEDYWKK